nr:MAG TPA: hypothetical protein [Caudoviricetes sp.]
MNRIHCNYVEYCAATLIFFRVSLRFAERGVHSRSFGCANYRRTCGNV